jgi:hypothetical protein
MKISHEKLVKLYKDMDYEVFDEYPAANIVMLRKKAMVWTYKTVVKSQVFNGTFGPDDPAICKKLED